MVVLLFACASETPDSASVDTGGGDSASDTADSADTVDTAEDSGGGELSFAAGDLHLAIPSYVDPGGPAWEPFVSGAAATAGLIVINPASGPGGHADEAYAAAVLAAQAEGVLVLGYVPTGYGERDGGEVDTEIAKYTSWYAVDGIFLDEVSDDCATYADYYAGRVAAADGQDPDGDAFVALNPGEVLDCDDYLATADVLVVAEDDVVNLRNFVAADWMATYDPARFWFLAYGAGASVLGQALGTARDNGIGWVYVTDANLPNPWNRPPAYWDDEIAATQADDP